MDGASELARLRDALARALPLPTAPFRPPATDADLARLAASIGRPVPADLASLLRVADGQEPADGTYGPVNLHRFLGVDEIIALHGMLGETVGDLSEPVAQPSAYSCTVWSPAWIPFMASEGDCYAIDLAPGETGVVGQVFSRPNVPDLEPPLADSIPAFLRKIVDVVDDGAYEVHSGSIVSADLF